MDYRKLIVLALLASPLCAEGPLFKHKDGFVDREFNNAYNDIRHALKGSIEISTMTVSSMTVTSLSVSSIASPALTAWAAYTPTVSDNTNVAIREGFWRRIGDSMELRVGVAWNGAGAGTDFTVELPSGYTIDTAKLPSNSILSLGNGQWADASTSRKIVAVRYNSTTVVSFDVSGGTSLIPGTDFADGDSLTFQILIPITGWTF